jgi:cellulose synthase/poly-beta-1,6-N-acetylglucosamine synthase-like glycosyltransferase
VATLLGNLLGGADVLLLLPVSVLFMEVVLAVTGAGKTSAAEPGGPRRRLAVLVPAHNESSMIAGTLHSILPQLGGTDRLLLVADNCSDDTAGVAAAAGAEVVVRTDLNRRGKGYALDFGVRHLERDAPDIVIIVDADCRVAPGAIDRLARVCARSNRPVQALYLMHARQGSGVNLQLAEFAWAVRNRVRPLGLHRLGLPCHLMGSGMAFPWVGIRSATLATGHIVEDLKLGIDLARRGTPPLFCPDALVTSEFPLSKDGVVEQRKRWEHGHLSVIFSEAPRLFWDSLTRAAGSLMALALDLCVPPLAFLTLLVAAGWVASGLFFVVTKARFPIAMSSVTACLLALSIFFSWARYGRHIISLNRLAFAMIYALRKIPLYAKFLVARQTVWVRSKREKED